MKLAIVIPVFNEEKVIRGVINSIPKKIKGIGKVVIIAVNDGSTDNSEKEIRETKAILLNHGANMGAGAATVTGLEGAKILKADIALTLDGDGQHDPRDIEKVIVPLIKKKADLVVGTRLKNPAGMPLYKRIGNIGLNTATFLLSGKWTSDTQSGFKGFSKNALNKLSFETPGYEFCSEIIINASQKSLKIVEIPIKVIYSDYSKKKGQSIFNGVNIIAKLIYNKLTKHI